ncbi:MAG TPA: NUDIX domain-containing protein [Patescibacteria group bacterium]|nr:NUDIX domain-containing protein [Patescibacteria group bacterium]
MDLFVTGRMLLFNHKGELLILRRSATDPFYGGMWDLPGGRMEDGEDIRQAAVRETIEEAGIQPLEPRTVFATSRIKPKGGCTWVFFVAQSPEAAEVKLSIEHDQYRWIKIEDFAQYTKYDVLLEMLDYVTSNSLIAFK